MTNRLNIVVSALLIFAVLAGIGVALTPPPPPPPPVPQSIGLNDTGIDQLVTTTLDQSACRACHQTLGTNISGGYNNTVGGVPTRHHSLLSRSVINPLTNAPFGCNDCHPPTPGIGNGILLDRSCVNCHNGTSFYANNIGGHVGNISRPHHIITNYTSVTDFGNPAANRTCNKCHGSFVDNYNDGHYSTFLNTSANPVVGYATDFMITPYATFKVTNTSQPTGLGGNKTWGGCLSCHLANPAATPKIGSNHDNHHKEILGFGRFGGQTAFQNASTPGAVCSWCHVIDYTNSTGLGSTFPLILNITNTIVSPAQNIIGAIEVRNSTVEAASVFEPGTTNITVNGTGCEKCHDVKSIHNIAGPGGYVSGGTQGLGHINNNLDCYGCHNSWLPADTNPWGAIIPSVNGISPSVIAVGTATTLTVTGANFVNDPYTSNVSIDGGVPIIPTSITDSQITVNIQPLAAGTHTLQLVKGVNTLSKISTLTVVPKTTITKAQVVKGVLTVTGIGFGTKPATNANMYVSVKDASGNQIVSTVVNGWSDTQIKVKNSVAKSGLVVTVITKDSGETTATIK